LKNILTILIFLLFLTSPLTIQYKETGFQFQGKAHGKELCEEDDEDCKEEGEEDSDDDSDHEEDDDDDEGDDSEED